MGREGGFAGWDRWETVEHLSDDLFAQAAQLGPGSIVTERNDPQHCVNSQPGHRSCRAAGAGRVAPGVRPRTEAGTDSSTTPAWGKL